MAQRDLQPSLFDGLAEVDPQQLWGEFARRPSSKTASSKAKGSSQKKAKSADTKAQKSKEQGVQKKSAAAESSGQKTPGQRAPKSSSSSRSVKTTAPVTLTADQLATHPLLTVRDLAHYAHGAASLEELSARVAHRSSAEFAQVSARLRDSLGSHARTMAPEDFYELVDAALAAVPAETAPTHTAPVESEPTGTGSSEVKPVEEPTPQKAPRKKVAQKSESRTAEPSKRESTKASQKKTAQKPASEKKLSEPKARSSVTKEPSTPKKSAAPKEPQPSRTPKELSPAKAAQQAQREAKAQAVQRYNAEERLENEPLKTYLPAPTAQAIKTHLKLERVGELLDYYPRKYLPRGELTSFSSLEEDQEVTLLARVVSVTTRQMASRRGRITEVIISDSLQDDYGHAETGSNLTRVQPNNPRISGLATASLSGYSDRFGQDTTDFYAPAQAGLFGVPVHTVGSRMKLSFFNAWTAARDLHAGESAMFSGKVGTYRGELTLTNPHYAVIAPDASAEDLEKAKSRANAPIPVYKATEKFTTDRIAAAIATLIDRAPLAQLEDALPYTLRRLRKVPSLEWTVRALHTPDSEDTWRAAQTQMRYREAFILQAALARLQALRAAQATVARPAIIGGFADALLAALPYELTEGQQKVGAEIAEDLASDSPMNRLLQGDVGSGKTVVALRAMLQVVDNRAQAALLAPTEVLAEQHFRSMAELLDGWVDTGEESATEPGVNESTQPAVRLRLLTASMPARVKKRVIAELAAGEVDIIIGTHALLSDGIRFHDLGMVVVDEQHRFGVEQRDGLRGPKGELPHRLVMTATPIPRTVAMTVFGDLDVSVLDQLPAGRQKITTHVVPLAEKPAWASRLWQRAREEIDAGHQVYVVVPKIGDDEDSWEEGSQLFGSAGTALDSAGRSGTTASDGRTQLTSVAGMYRYVQQQPALAGCRIAYLHGRMDPDEKSRVMTDFAAGSIDLLVCTTVIEVGVNVPNATLMMIMDADRFGISGLHQLRGRVGRGQHAGTCLLITRQGAEGASRERLEAVASTTDGFELSRIDLEQRREGDILGAAQSGTKSNLRFLRALADATIIERAREDARSVVASDPTLAKHPNLARTIDRALDADREAFLGRG
ncbi:MAG: helicase-related protein [Rothia sp. (in: high G+C Gram-positive bacteria)]|uniref:helicase-related protein n=1 Tax=Rothia sp. (in: high G+C Gram-positive bacteria) TaxID=1885016 RepID=UPI0026DF27C6|nr:helicase-related protein [Rothia sp. (in: high G+C Gram-positive bacteria)]MDO5750955.1 helicase-related protein [Rothia sp. (in: high G+C Gram-positive bacteria)]